MRVEATLQSASQEESESKNITSVGLNEKTAVSDKIP